jgi:hypothetical protein
MANAGAGAGGPEEILEGEDVKLKNIPPIDGINSIVNRFF